MLIERIKPSRRELLMGLGLVGVASLVSGDTAPKPLESPIGKYDFVVAAGDSYTYGLGASRPEYGYAARLADRLQAKRFLNIARNGWSAREMLNGSGNYPSQIDQLPPDADLVLMTIGGNAINLRTFGAACISAGCGQNTSVFKNAFAEYDSDKHYEDLESDYRETLAKASNADVLVSGYPKIIVPYRLPNRVEAFLLGVGAPALTVLGRANDAAISDLVEMSNTASKEIIRRIDDPRLVYVEPPKHVDIISTRLLGQPDHFNIDLNADSENAGHPNDFGYEDMDAAAFVALVAVYNRYIRKSESLVHVGRMGK